ncbi:MAG TPA: glucoamylase family protein, partial [Thermomicrobiales bacterium]|nr:glucoamylase family protein [Thermomicrobiales bacterium]
PPGQGDVFRLEVEFDEFTLDGDPETWQRISLPLDDLKAGDFDRKTTVGVVFRHGAPNEATRTLWFDLLTIEQNDDEAFLDMVQQKTFDFFWMEANPSNGLVRDRTGQNYASIAAVGFGLSAMTVGIDRGWITPEQGRERVLNTLEFFWTAEQSTAPNATGYKGFFYHFLDMNTGRRSGTNELSTIDTALLLGGVLHVREYFVDDDEIRSLADSIYHRVDWTWMQYRNPNNPTAAISHGWFPDPEGRANADPSTGFIVHDWLGYNEAMILYILALGSPTHPVGPEAWDAWASGYGGQWQTHYGYTYLVFPPLFGHQYSHVWIDFRGIQDAFMEEKGIDYFENSRRATLAQRAYHIANPGGYPNYSKDEWGLTASDTPDGYSARGAPPPQNDDGTIAPTAPGGSIAFAPDESIAALRTMHRKYPALWGPYGFRDAYNVDRNWFAQTYLGIDQGPILLMIENHRTEAIWEVAMRNESIRRGLERAGFTGVGVAVDDPVEVARTDVLAVFPNPTADRARVNYVLDAPSSVRLVLYDVLGRELTVLEDATRPAGEHQLDMDLTMRPSGLYLLVFEMGDRRTTRVLTKIE